MPTTENIRLDVNISTDNNVNKNYSYGNQAFNEKVPSIFIDQAINLYREGKMSYHDLIGETNTIVSAVSKKMLLIFQLRIKNSYVHYTTYVCKTCNYIRKIVFDLVILVIVVFNMFE